MFINQILTKLKTSVYSKSETETLLNSKGFITSEIDSMGEGWVRFKCGLQICWGTVAIAWSLHEQFPITSFAKSFKGIPSVSLSHERAGYTDKSFSAIRLIDESRFIAEHMATSADINPGGNLLWSAIGKWK